jgi:DNA-binding Lrp family transcriptional regulator
MEIDRIRVSQLPSRYGIARSAVYTRLKDLQIEPIKEGRKAYVNNEQLQLLDSLHEHISKGGVTSDFLQQKGQQSTTVSGTDDSSALVQDNPGQIFPLQAGALVAVLEAIVKRLAPSSPLDYLRDLEEAYEKGWLLSTSELANLLKLSPKTIASYGESFEEAGFVFTRYGKRKKGEIAWIIGKAEEVEYPFNSSAIAIKEVFSDDYDPPAD